MRRKKKKKNEGEKNRWLPSSLLSSLWAVWNPTVHLCEALTPIPRFLSAKCSEKAGGSYERGNGGWDGSRWEEERKEATPWPHTLSVSLQPITKAGAGGGFD